MLPDTSFDFTETIKKVDVYWDDKGIARITFFYANDNQAFDLQGTAFTAQTKSTFTVPTGEFLLGQIWTSDGVQQSYTYQSTQFLTGMNTCS